MKACPTSRCICIICHICAKMYSSRIHARCSQHVSAPSLGVKTSASSAMDFAFVDSSAAAAHNLPWSSNMPVSMRGCLRRALESVGKWRHLDDMRAPRMVQLKGASRVKADLYEPCVSWGSRHRQLHGEVVALQKHQVRVMLLCPWARSEVTQRHLRDGPDVICKIKTQKGKINKYERWP